MRGRTGGFRARIGLAERALDHPWQDARRNIGQGRAPVGCDNGLSLYLSLSLLAAASWVLDTSAQIPIPPTER